MASNWADHSCIGRLGNAGTGIAEHEVGDQDIDTARLRDQCVGGLRTPKIALVGDDSRALLLQRPRRWRGP